MSEETEWFEGQRHLFTRRRTGRGWWWALVLTVLLALALAMLMPRLA